MVTINGTPVTTENIHALLGLDFVTEQLPDGKRRRVPAPWIDPGPTVVRSDMRPGAMVRNNDGITSEIAKVIVAGEKTDRRLGELERRVHLMDTDTDSWLGEMDRK